VFSAEVGGKSKMTKDELISTIARTGFQGLPYGSAVRLA
jgi:hypothetical protein